MLDSITRYFLLFVSFFFLFSLGWFGIISIKEKEKRAALISLSLACLFFSLVFVFSFQNLALRGALIVLMALTAVIGLILFLVPLGRMERVDEKPPRRFDERDIMFARARLEPGSAQFEAYYQMRPENKAGDEETRKKPGLLAPGSTFADPRVFISPDASFFLTGALRDAVDGPVAEKRIDVPPAAMSRYIKDLGRYYGAVEVGITKLQHYHVYSHIGRGSGSYGAPISIEHDYAIAFTVEMDYEMVGTAPTAPTVMESARQYVEAARVAVQLAAAIRAMGFAARAHIDGNYRVIAPLVARDANLGEIGRMGLLMTPRLGPRVRLGVVTTTLPLEIDLRQPDPSVTDFCQICKKCAECCPSRSIALGDREEIEGVLRWKINSDTCFRYWATVGTDCGRCMAVCPYSHPDNLAHNLVRWGIRNSGVFRRVALRMDDLFYGRKPKPREKPDWILRGQR